MISNFAIENENEKNYLAELVLDNFEAKKSQILVLWLQSVQILASFNISLIISSTVSFIFPPFPPIFSIKKFWNNSNSSDKIFILLYSLLIYKLKNNYF